MYVFFVEMGNVREFLYAKVEAGQSGLLCQTILLKTDTSISGCILMLHIISAYC